MKSLRLYFCVAVCLTLMATQVIGRDPESYDDLDHPMFTDPDLFIPPPVRAFDEGLAELWTSSLFAPEKDVRRRCAETIALARSVGMEGLEMSIPNLVTLANDEQENAYVRFAALRALVALDAQGEADTILRIAVRLGSDAEADAVKALARWKYEPARDMWRERLATDNTSHRQLLHAINGLVAMDDGHQNEQLEKIIVDQFAPIDARLAAARGLASLQREGLESLVKELLSAEPSHRRQHILAAVLLRYHTGSASEELLETLALDSEPAAANAALERLIEIAPTRIETHHTQLLASRDANVRRWTVQALALFPNEAHTSVLATVTNDRNPGIRVLTRDTLLMFAKEHGLRDAVLQEADKLLLQEDWRGIEQACRLAGSLDHKAAAPELIRALENRRLEAHTTAAWALRRLAIPETLPDVLSVAQALTAQAMNDVPPEDPERNYDPLLSQIFEFFGEMQYQPADPLLQRYVPKLAMTEQSRAAAIWALGHIHKANPPADLIAALEERLLDVGSVPPESPHVRTFCAVTLGRLKASGTLPSLRRFYEESGPYTPPSYACGWAIEQITGEQVEKPLPVKDYLQGWFMVPLR